MPPAPTSEAGNARPLAISLFLAGSMCVLPFLLPYNQPNQAEWLAAALGIAAVVAALAQRLGSVVALPALGRWLSAFVVFLVVQAIVAPPVYPQVWMLAALYLLYAILLIWLGAQLAESNGVERVATALAACLLAGALANAAAGAIQFYGRPKLLEDLVAELPYHFGAFGNIGQANLYANYLALGGTALLFLWLRGGLRTGFALAAAILLACALALSGSRTSLLYLAWFVLPALLANRALSRAGRRRLGYAAATLTALILLAHFTVPWINGAFAIGNAARGVLERVAGHTPDPRWQIWLLAWRVFAEAPVFGAGIGEFAGAAFRSGLSPESTQLGGQVWTSPHNLVLQLLAETGAVGAFLALGGLCVWCWQAGRRYFAGSEPAIWWIIAAVGIALTHSMFEFPLWNAHFLGVTALLTGLGASPTKHLPVTPRVTWTALAIACATLALAQAMLLKDYVRLNATRITGTTLTLASAADAARDASMMSELTQGLLAPAAEYWIVLGAALDRHDLAEKLNMSARVAHHYPTNAILVRRAAFLAFDGKTAEARRLLEQAIHTFPKRCGETVRILAPAITTDPGAIEPLFTLAKGAGGPDCN